MLVVLLAVLAVGGAAVVLLGGASGLLAAGSRSRSSTGCLGRAAVVGGGVMLLLLLGGGFVVVVGTGGTDGGNEDRGSESAESVDQPGRSEASARPSRLRLESPRAVVVEQQTVGGVPARQVTVRASSATRFRSRVVLEELSDGTLLRVDARGFGRSSTGRVRQCVVTQGVARACGNAFPVTFDASGTARFQYLVTSSFLPPDVRTDDGSCGSERLDCVIRIDGGERSATMATVFGGRAPAGDVVVTPAPTALEPGSAITLRLRALPPGTVVSARLCAASAAVDPSRCDDAPASTRSARVDPSGRAILRAVVPEREIGSRGLPCGDFPCAFVVTTDSGFVVVPLVPVSFTDLPGASYDTTRLVGGLLVAPALLLAAWVLVRTTDWRKPSEADTPAMDAALLVDEEESTLIVSPGEPEPSSVH